MGESQYCMEAMGNFAVSEEKRIERENEIARAVRKALQGYGIPQVQPTRCPQYKPTEGSIVDVLEERLLYLSAEADRLAEENKRLMEENKQLKAQAGDANVLDLLRQLFIDEGVVEISPAPNDYGISFGCESDSDTIRSALMEQLGR